MDFYETQMGRNFFERQLPTLIRVLEDISSSLSRKKVISDITDRDTRKFP